MTPTEQIRAFVEEVKGEHVEMKPDLWNKDPRGKCDVCDYTEDTASWPCSAIRAVLALEEMTEEVVGIECNYGCKAEHYRKCSRRGADEALARAAQKIGGER